MNQKQIDLKQAIIKKRGYLCEICHARPITDIHHALIGRDKRFPELNCEENFAGLCHEDHMAGKGDTHEFRVKFWKDQCRRYGKEHMQEWLASFRSK